MARKKAARVQDKLQPMRLCLEAKSWVDDGKPVRGVCVRDPKGHVWELAWVPGIGLTLRLSGHGVANTGMNVHPLASNHVAIRAETPWPTR